MTEPDERAVGGEDLRMLVAVADGSLRDDELQAAEQRIAGSLMLQALLAEQRFAVAHARRRDVTAPASLRSQLEREGRGRRWVPVAAPARRRRWALVLGGCVAAAVVIVAVLPGGTPAAPSVVQAATLATLPATAPAPASSPADPRILSAVEQGVAFPNWAAKFGWKASGRRTDELGGHATTTVFYDKQADKIAYTIVAGRPLGAPTGAVAVMRNGVAMRTLLLHGRLVVTFTRKGHTCVLVGPPVKRAVLLKLASWRADGHLSF
jgi:hypothetical protein